MAPSQKVPVSGNDVCMNRGAAPASGHGEIFCLTHGESRSFLTHDIYGPALRPANYRRSIPPDRSARSAYGKDPLWRGVLAGRPTAAQRRCYDAAQALRERVLRIEAGLSRRHARLCDALR
jgi:hypothetical protein